jgi:hypothetical protein
MAPLATTFIPVVGEHRLSIWSLGNYRTLVEIAIMQIARAYLTAQSTFVRMWVSTSFLVVWQESVPAQPTIGTLNEANGLVVMVTGKLGAQDSFGSGIICGFRQHTIYIATADHVVRNGLTEIAELQVEIWSRRGIPMAATLLADRDTDHDLAVLAVDADPRALGLPSATALSLRFGTSATLHHGDKVNVIGYADRLPWKLLGEPGTFDKAVAEKLQFTSQYVVAGDSGGALFDAKWNVVGMVRGDEHPNAEALSIERVLADLKDWNYLTGSDGNLSIEENLDEVLDIMRSSMTNTLNSAEKLLPPVGLAGKQYKPEIRPLPYGWSAVYVFPADTLDLATLQSIKAHFSSFPITFRNGRSLIQVSTGALTFGDTTDHLNRKACSIAIRSGDPLLLLNNFKDVLTDSASDATLTITRIDGSHIEWTEKTSYNETQVKIPLDALFTSGYVRHYYNDTLAKDYVEFGFYQGTTSFITVSQNPVVTYGANAKLTGYSIEVKNADKADRIFKLLLMSGFYMGKWDISDLNRITFNHPF